jgi:hypothetical protein
VIKREGKEECRKRKLCVCEREISCSVAGFIAELWQFYFYFSDFIHELNSPTLSLFLTQHYNKKETKKGTESK